MLWYCFYMAKHGYLRVVFQMVGAATVFLFAADLFTAAMQREPGWLKIIGVAMGMYMASMGHNLLHKD